MKMQGEEPQAFLRKCVLKQDIKDRVEMPVLSLLGLVRLCSDWLAQPVCSGSSCSAEELSLHQQAYAVSVLLLRKVEEVMSASAAEEIGKICL